MQPVTPATATPSPVPSSAGRERGKISAFETTLAREWIDVCLCMGTATHVASLLQRYQQKGPNSEEALS